MLKKSIVRNEPQHCKKFSKLNAAELITHIKEDRCLECFALLHDLQREHEIIDALWKRRN